MRGVRNIFSPACDDVGRPENTRETRETAKIVHRCVLTEPTLLQNDVHVPTHLVHVRKSQFRMTLIDVRKGNAIAQI